MPGEVIQGMKKAEASNPLLLLDEVGYFVAGWRGDPSSAPMTTQRVISLS